MSQIGLTSLVNNVSYAKQLGVSPFYYRYRSCNNNFPNRRKTSVTGFTPAEQYQKLSQTSKFPLCCQFRSINIL